MLDVSLALRADERDAYLSRVCETDSDLREEVESLIEAHEAAGDLFETPILKTRSDSLIGRRLGAYEMVECIGSGGMGTVYRAARVDDAFDKEVAIKIVRRGLDLDRVVRQFRRERQITANLEHPNICALLDGGSTEEGLPYFVMEFIRGKPLDQYCDEMKLDTAARIELLISVCAAVQFAHERGVIHRDIKPANILVTGSGVPKLLDFGIAKILNPESFLSGKESVGTIAPAMTPEYASPEQLCAGVVTEASDVYSLGVVLYQLITGQRPAPRRGVVEEFGAPRTGDTPAPRGIPRDLNRIVAMAVQVDPERRYRTAADLEADLRRFVAGRPVRAGRSRPFYVAAKLVSRYKGSVAAAAVALTLAGAAIVLTNGRGRGPAPQVAPLTSLPGSESEPAFSPDGKSIVYVWNGENANNNDLYLQSLADGSVRRLTNDPAEDLSPVWSPDGSRIAWLRSGPNEAAVYLMDLAGGPQRKIADVYPIRVDVVGRNLDWSPDGERLAVADKSRPEEPFHIAFIRVSDGVKSGASFPPDKSIGDMNPAFSPNGKSLAFFRAISSGARDVYIAPLGPGLPRRLTSDNRDALSLAWTPDSRSIVFSSDRRRNSALWIVPASGGEPERLAGPGENAADPAFARDGRMAYTQSFHDANVWRIGTDGKGPAVKVISSTQYDSSPQYSPDGSRVAFRSNRSGSNEIWVSDSNGRIPVQLTHYAGPLTGTPRWSPSGMQIAFDTRPDGQAEIYVVSSIGGEPRRVTSSEAEDVVPSWSRDGAWIYFASNRTGAWQVWRVPSNGGAEEQVTHDGGFAAFESPDGEWLYYAKGRSAPGVWRKRLPNGPEEPVLPQLTPGYWGYWAVVENGIYYADQTPKAAGAIFFYSFADGKSRQLATTDRPLAVTDSAFAVSPDRKYILYTQVDQVGSDIYVLDRWK